MDEDMALGDIKGFDVSGGRNGEVRGSMNEEEGRGEQVGRSKVREVFGLEEGEDGHDDKREKNERETRTAEIGPTRAKQRLNNRFE